VLLLLPFGLIAQRNLQATKITSGKTVIIEEGQRVKVRTDDGERYYGRITLLDDQTILLRKDTLQLNNIVTIQKRPATKGVVTALMIGAGTLGVAFTPVVALSSGTGAIALLAVASSVVTTGIVLPSLAGNHSRKRWNYKINTL